MSQATDYPHTVRAFVTRHSWTTEALYSREVIDIAVQFLKMPETVRADIRRCYIAQMKPPATMMNVALSYQPLKRTVDHEAPTRPIFRRYK